MPITKYATQLVGNLAKEAGYPADFVAAYTANIASKEDNVKAVVAKIELGEGDAGIVYVTDAKASTKVATVDVPDSANVPATYAGVVVKASQERGGGEGVPRLVRRTGRPGDPGRLRVPAAVVIDGRPGDPAAVGRAASARRGDAPAAGASGRSSSSRACSPCSSACRSLTLVVRAVVDGSLVDAVASPVVLDALWLSLVTTAVSLVITVSLGLPLAFVLARPTFRGKGWLEAIIDLPIVLPPSVAGLALLLVFGRRGLLAGRWSSSGCPSRSHVSP